MSQVSLADYIALRKAELIAFEANWRECMVNNPKDYDFEHATVEEWNEQEEAYFSMERGE